MYNDTLGSKRLNMIKDGSELENRFMKRLIEEYGYSKESIRSYVPLSKGQARYMIDIMVYHQGSPFIVVEVKSQQRGISRDVEMQLMQYMIVSGAEYGVVTDNIKSMYYRLHKGSFSRISDIPSANSIESNEKPPKELLPIKYVHDTMSNEFSFLGEKTKSGISALADFSKIIATKFYDEKENKSKTNFYASINEDAETVKSRIESILLEIKDKIGISKEIQLEAKYVKDIVIRLQKYSFLKSELTENGWNIMYPQLITDPELGESVTPLNLVKFITELAEIQKNQLVIDPACGLGGILVEASKYGAQVLGIDISQPIVEIAKINMYLIGQNPQRIICQDSLRPLEKIDPKKTFKEQFDLVITNPPFGYKITDERLDYYQFKRPSGGMIEDMFVEQSTKLVKNKGKIVIILPEGFFFNVQNEKIREFLLQNFKIDAIISLPPKLFFPTTAIKTSLLVLTKIKPQPNQKIFFAKVIPDDSKNSSDNYEEQFNNIVAAYKEYHKKNTVNKKYTNIILTKISDNRRFDFDYYEGHNIDKVNYPTKLLSEIAELQLGAKIEYLQEKMEGFEVLPVRGQNIRDLSIDTSSVIPIKIDRELNYKYLTQTHDILMTRAGSPGNVGIVQQIIPVFIKENLIRIRPNRNVVDPYYLLAFLSSKEGQERLQKASTGSTIKAINLQNLLSLQIPIPPLEIQKRISRKILDLLEMKKEIKEMQLESETRLKSIDDSIDSLFQRRDR